MDNPDQPDQDPPTLGPPANDAEKTSQDTGSGRISNQPDQDPPALGPPANDAEKTSQDTGSGRISNQPDQDPPALGPPANDAEKTSQDTGSGRISNQPDQDPPALGPPANDTEKTSQDTGSGRISKKKLQRERLILALLEQPTLAKAAASAGMSDTTAWRISKTREFEEEYLASRRQLVSQGSARLQKAYGAAVSKITKLMVDPGVPPEVQLRAAELILRHAESALQSEDLATRLKRLEPQKEGKGKKV